MRIRIVPVLGALSALMVSGCAGPAPDGSPDGSKNGPAATVPGPEGGTPTTGQTAEPPSDFDIRSVELGDTTSGGPAGWGVRG